MLNPINVEYEYTNNPYKARQWFEALPDMFAADFEVASKYTKEKKKLIQYRLDNHSLNFEAHRQLLQQLTSTGLSHPSLTCITHLSIGWDKDKAKVIVCDTERIRRTVLNFLVTTDKTQLWHNSVFDFKHIYYHTGKLPKEYLDTQLLSKCLLNNADSFKDRVGLKDLMGYLYGDWAVAKEDFTLEEMWSPHMIRYAAIDSAATFKLYQDIQEDLSAWKI